MWSYNSKRDGWGLLSNSILSHSFVHLANSYWMAHLFQALGNQRRKSQTQSQPSWHLQISENTTAINYTHCLPCARHYDKQITFYNDPHNILMLMLFDRWGNQGSEMLKQLAQGHIASKWQTWGLNTNLADSKFAPLSTLLYHFCCWNSFWARTRRVENYGDWGICWLRYNSLNPRGKKWEERQRICLWGLTFIEYLLASKWFIYSILFNSSDILMNQVISFCRYEIDYFTQKCFQLKNPETNRGSFFSCQFGIDSGVQQCQGWHLCNSLGLFFMVARWMSQLQPAFKNQVSIQNKREEKVVALGSFESFFNWKSRKFLRNPLQLQKTSFYVPEHCQMSDQAAREVKKVGC